MTSATSETGNSEIKEEDLEGHKGNSAMENKPPSMQICPKKNESYIDSSSGPDSDKHRDLVKIEVEDRSELQNESSTLCRWTLDSSGKVYLQNVEQITQHLDADNDDNINFDLNGTTDIKQEEDKQAIIVIQPDHNGIDTGVDTVKLQGIYVTNTQFEKKAMETISEVHSDAKHFDQNKNKDVDVIDRKNTDAPNLPRILPKPASQPWKKAQKKRKEQHVCVTCGVTCSTLQSLNSHTKAHIADKPFTCIKCGQCFAGLNQLNGHMGSHAVKKKIYSCKECGKEFTKSSYLKQHIRTHNREKRYACELCPSTFTQLGNLFRHKKRHTSEKPYKCEICGKSFAEKKFLVVHKRKHIRENHLKCSVCEKVYARADGLMRHMKTHTGKEPYTCSICGKPFMDKRDMIAHNSLHTGIKEFKCSDCGKLFSRASSLAQHSKLHKPKTSLDLHKNIDDGPYLCVLCGRKFRNKNKLMEHHTTKHLQDSCLYPCAICGIKFSSKDKLTEHHKTKHIQDSWPYGCVTCGIKFCNKDKLIEHHETKHMYSGE